jgi:hypothetical protein
MSADRRVAFASLAALRADGAPDAECLATCPAFSIPADMTLIGGDVVYRR